MSRSETDILPRLGSRLSQWNSSPPISAPTRPRPRLRTVPKPSRSHVIRREASPPPIRPTTTQTTICATVGIVIIPSPAASSLPLDPRRLHDRQQPLLFLVAIGLGFIGRGRPNRGAEFGVALLHGLLGKRLHRQRVGALDHIAADAGGTDHGRP